MQKITPFLWFDGQAEEAADFYVSIFKNSKVKNIRRSSPNGPAFSVTFQIEDQDFFALNGGPQYTFTPAISFFVNCDTQEELDELWKRLSEGGEKDQCRWLKDKFGVSWQIVPNVLGEMLQDKDANKSERVMKALLQMKKIDIQGLRIAYEGQ